MERRFMRPNLFWLDDHQWQQIEPHLPTDVRGKERADDRRGVSGIPHVLRGGWRWGEGPPADDRRVISGILHVLRSGCRWKDCPPEYGPHTTIYNRFAGGKGGSRNRRL